MLKAGSASADITPVRPVFLFGYPRTPRISTGVHDPLLVSALAIQRGDQCCLFVAADVISISKLTTARARQRIAEATGVAAPTVLISATHTHSGPVTTDFVSNRLDPAVPRADPKDLALLEDGIVRAAVSAWNARRPAELAISVADATGIGTCRHDPAGPNDLEVPVLWARDADSRKPIGIHLVCAMHPTVLHEDSTLVSGDFPAIARRYLQARFDCPVVYHTGCAGDQSPRHVTRENTFDEATRLGEILGRAVESSIAQATFVDDVELEPRQRFVTLPMRQIPSAEAAQARLDAARARFEHLRSSSVDRAAIRTAECDVFGAEELVAMASPDAALDEAMSSIMPAEIQVLRVGNVVYVAWPGELFVEFALQVRAVHPEARIITLANGDLQGYVVTQQAVENHYYESGNALLESPDSGERIVRATLELIGEMGDARG